MRFAHLTNITFFNGERRRLFVIICILLFLAILARCAFFNGGIRGADAYAYAMRAHQIATGQYQLDSVNHFYGFRYIVLVPTALSYFLFGVNDISSSLLPFICSLLNIIIIFLIGNKLFGWQIALLSGVLLAFYPLDILFASLLGPDSFIPLFSSLVILFYLIAEEKESSSFRSALFFILSGIFIALAVSARLTSIFLYGVVMLHQIMKRERTCSFFYISLGLAIPLIVEATYYYLNTGDPVFRIHVIDNIKTSIMRYYSESAGSFLYYPKLMFGFNLQGWATYGLTWWLALAGILWAGLNKDKKILFPAIWLILPFLGFEFGLQSLKETILISKNYNYLSLITPPAMLISAYFIKESTSLFLNKKKSILVLIVTILTIACMNLYGTYRLTLNIKDDAAPYIVVADYLKKQQARVIYAHPSRWPLFLNYFLHYPGNLDFRDLNNVSQTEMDQLSGAYVILNKKYLEADTMGRAFKSLPFYAQYLNSPPPKWTKVVSFIGRPPYNSVNMYYVP
jgi:4-amino-4-deoxy-L-arabinose transferase-like glycosyltransferase